MKFIRESNILFTGDFIKTVYEGKLEYLKQNALYVGYPRNIDINSKASYSTPFKINRSQAGKQISILHFSIIDLLKGVLNETNILVTSNDKRIFNKSNYKYLKTIWRGKPINGKTDFWEYLVKRVS
jgi:hypothetical protein